MQGVKVESQQGEQSQIREPWPPFGRAVAAWGVAAAIYHPCMGQTCLCEGPHFFPEEGVGLCTLPLPVSQAPHKVPPSDNLALGTVLFFSWGYTPKPGPQPSVMTFGPHVIYPFLPYACFL